ncbi:diguanylate cyclase [Natronospirillum operosum]|uniref:diguanylate cyclase n=1 Tax=Natronospirillum operosum TaxID=2759953 RepID=A0A4Z0W821_9GAMM|nr:GGDEF domain-containing protein [Natronospirillum operosum]TGG94214.1 diguanylate cyclase [Natronospirillum operosum]
MSKAVNRHWVSRWHSLTTRQAVLTFVIALIISIIAGLIELLDDVRVLRADIQQQTGRLLQLAGATAAEAAFQLNEELGEQVVSGIYNGGDVSRVVLRDDFGRVMASRETIGEADSGALLRHLFGDITDYHVPLTYDMGGGRAAEAVGELDMQLSLRVIGDAFLERSALIFSLGMLKALVIALLVVLTFHVLITRPLLRVYTAIVTVDPDQPGNWSRPRFRAHRNDELGSLVQALDDLLRAFQKGLDQRDELHQISTIDGLTGIPNRRRFDEFLARQWLDSRRQKSPLAVIFIDIDYFKPFNDNYGHGVGDDCLREVARALTRALPRATDLVARYGGEEFVCILPHTDLDGACAVAERLRLAIQALAIPHAWSDVDDLVTVSMGVASAVPGRAGSWSQDDLLAAADRRLYQAKQNGRNRIVSTDD